MAKAKSKAKSKKAAAAKTGAAAQDPTHAYSIYRPIEGHLSGMGSLEECKQAVRDAFPDDVVVLDDEEATGRVLGKVDGGNVATIVLLTPKN